MTKNKEKQRAYDREWRRRWRAQNPEKVREQQNLARSRLREIVHQAKDTKCADCRIKYPYYVMQFDHKDNSKKSFTIGRSYYGKGRKQLLEEIAKCDVVCSNCHAIRTWGRLAQ